MRSDGNLYTKFLPKGVLKGGQMGIYSRSVFLRVSQKEVRWNFKYTNGEMMMNMMEICEQIVFLRVSQKEVR
jgi:hypothetical protein